VLGPEFYEEGRPGSVNRDVHAGIIVDYIPITYPKLTIIGLPQRYQKRPDTAIFSISSIAACWKQSVRIMVEGTFSPATQEA